MAEEQDLARKLNATDAQIEAFVARLDKFLGGNLKKILRDIKTGKAKEAAKALGSLQSALRELGLQDVLNTLPKVYKTTLKAIDDELSASVDRDTVLNDVDRTVAEMLIKFDTNVIANKVNALTDDLSSTIMRQVITGETIDVDQYVDTLGSRTVAQIKTELNTATIAFSRSITQKKANDLGLNLFLYVGPLDKITRPFCRARVGKIYTREEINSWDNGQGLPANLYCGGYNCRHDLRPITEERAKKLGYDNQDNKAA